MAGEVPPPGKFPKATLRQTPLPVLEEFSYRELQFSCSYSKTLQDFVLSGVRLFELDELPEEYATENGFGPKFKNLEWLDLIWNFLIVITILSCSLLMSILGILWCVFRKKFSKKVRENENRIKRKIRLCVTLLLLLLTLSLIVALVMAYKMNEMFGDVTKPRSRFVNGLNVKARAQVDGIARQISTLLNENFRELKTYLSDYLQTTVRDMLELLKIKGRLLYIGELEEYRNQLDDLLINTMRFVDDVRFFARNMSVALDKTESGRQIYTITRMKYFQDSAIKMDELARLDGLLESLESIVQSLKNIHEEVETLLSESRMEKVVQEINQPIINHLEEQELQLNRFEQGVNKKLRTAMNGLEATTRIGSVVTAYRLGVLFCIIVTLIAVGLLCSLIIGLLKDFGVGGALTSKVPAARILAATIWLIFMTIFAIGIISSYYFLLGMVVHSGLCKSTLGKSRKLESPGNLLIRHCKQKETAYVTLLNDKLMEKLNISLFPSAALEQLECPFCGFAASNDIFATNNPVKIVERASRISSSLQEANYDWLKNSLNLDYISEVYQQIQDNNASIFDENDHSNTSCVLQYFKQSIDNIARGKILPGAELMTTIHKHLMTHFAPNIKTTIERYMTNGLSKLFGYNFRTDKDLRKQHKPHEFHSNSEATFKNLLEDFKQKAEDYMFSKLKSCEPIVRPYRALMTGTCTCLHLGLNGFWIFAFIIFFLLLPICCLSLYLKQLYEIGAPRKLQSAPLNRRKKKGSPLFACCQKKESKAPLLDDSNERSAATTNPQSSFSNRREGTIDTDSTCGSKCTCPSDTTQISLVFNRNMTGNRSEKSANGVTSVKVAEDNDRITEKTPTQGSIERPKSIMKDKNVKQKTSKLFLCCQKKAPKEEDKTDAVKPDKKWSCCKKKDSKASVPSETSEVAKERLSTKKSSSVSFKEEEKETSKTWFCCKKKDSKASVASDTDVKDKKKKTSKMWLCCNKKAATNAAGCGPKCTCIPSVESAGEVIEAAGKNETPQAKKPSKPWLCCKKKDSKSSVNTPNEEDKMSEKTSKRKFCCKKKPSKTSFKDDSGEQVTKRNDKPTKKWSCCLKKPSKVEPKCVPECTLPCNTAQDRTRPVSRAEQLPEPSTQMVKQPIADRRTKTVEKVKKEQEDVESPKQARTTEQQDTEIVESRKAARKPQTVEPQIVEPQIVEPQIVEPQRVEPQRVEPQIVEPQIVEPQRVEPQRVEPQIVEPQIVEPQTTTMEKQVLKTQQDELPVERPQQDTPTDEPKVYLLSGQTPGMVPIEKYVPQWVCNIGCTCKSRARRRRKTRHRCIGPQMFQPIGGQFTNRLSQPMFEQFAVQQISEPGTLMGEQKIFYWVPGEQVSQWHNQTDSEFSDGGRDSSTSSRESRRKRKLRRRRRQMSGQSPFMGYEMRGSSTTMGGQKIYSSSKPIAGESMLQPDEERGEQFFAGARDSSVDSKDSNNHWEMRGLANRGRKTVEWHAEPEVMSSNRRTEEWARVPRSNLPILKEQVSLWNMQTDEEFYDGKRDSSTSSRESRRERKARRRARRRSGHQLTDEVMMPGQGPSQSTDPNGQQIMAMKNGAQFPMAMHNSSGSSKDSRKAIENPRSSEDAMGMLLDDGFSNAHRQNTSIDEKFGQLTPGPEAIMHEGQKYYLIPGEQMPQRDKEREQENSSTSSRESRQRRKSRRKAGRESSSEYTDEEEMQERYQMPRISSMISRHQIHASSMSLAGEQKGEQFFVAERENSIDGKSAEEVMKSYAEEDEADGMLDERQTNTSTVEQSQSVEHIQGQKDLLKGERDSSSGSRDSQHRYKAKKGSNVQFADEQIMSAGSRKSVEFAEPQILGSSTEGGRWLSSALQMHKSSISLVEPQTSWPHMPMNERFSYVRRRSSTDFRRKKKFKAKRKARWGSSRSIKERKSSTALSRTIDEQDLDDGIKTDESSTSLTEQFVSKLQMVPPNTVNDYQLVAERSAPTAEVDGTSVEATEIKEPNTDAQQTSRPSTSSREEAETHSKSILTQVGRELEMPESAKAVVTQLRYRQKGSASLMGTVNQPTDKPVGVLNPTTNNELNSEQKPISEVTEKPAAEQNINEASSSISRQLKYRKRVSESQIQTDSQFIDARDGIVDCSSDCFCDRKKRSILLTERRKAGRTGSVQRNRVQKVHSADQLTYRQQMPRTQKRTVDQNVQVNEDISNQMEHEQETKDYLRDRFMRQAEMTSQTDPIGAQMLYRDRGSLEQTANQFVPQTEEHIASQVSNEQESSPTTGGQPRDRKQKTRSGERKTDRFEIREYAPEYTDVQFKAKRRKCHRRAPTDEQLTKRKQIAETKGELLVEAQLTERPEMPGTSKQAGERLQREHQDAAASESDRLRISRRTLKMTGVRMYHKPKGHKASEFNVDDFNVDL